MPYCMQCTKMNLQDRNKFNEALCTDRNRYYDPYSSACSNIEYIDTSLRNREDENEKAQNSSCYLTTAMCHALGYTDDCDYLATLRNFRDTYMMQDADSIPLLIEYEVIGPMISKRVANDKEMALTMLNDYIAKAILEIRKGQYTQAVTTYRAMVYHLKEQYHLQNVNVDISEVEIKQEEPLTKQKIRDYAKSAKLIRAE